MARVEPAPRVSIPDYLAGEQAGDVKHEYLGGTVHAMAGGSNRHNAIATNAVIALGSGLRGKPCRPFNSDTKVRIESLDRTIAEPAVEGVVVTGAGGLFLAGRGGAVGEQVRIRVGDHR